MPLWQEEGPLWAGRQGGRPTAPSPQPHGHPGPHAPGTDTPASACPCVRLGGDQWPVSLGQVRPDAVRAVAVPADPLHGLLRPGHPATNGEQPPGWSQSPQRGLGAGGGSTWACNHFQSSGGAGTGLHWAARGPVIGSRHPSVPRCLFGDTEPWRAEGSAQGHTWGVGGGVWRRWPCRILRLGCASGPNGSRASSVGRRLGLATVMSTVSPQIGLVALGFAWKRKDDEHFFAASLHEATKDLGAELEGFSRTRRPRSAGCDVPELEEVGTWSVVVTELRASQGSLGVRV